MKAGRILIVEDDPMWQEFLQDPLHEDYILTVVSNRTEAEAALNEAQQGGQPFDVVTVDIGLERDGAAMEGEELLALISRHHRHIKCIVVSGHHSLGTTKLRNYFKEFEVFDYVSKAEFDLVHFKEVVDKAFHFHGYRILEELGRGGMGIVYKALDPQHDNRVVAIKVLHSNPGISPEAVTRRIARFSQEVETVRRLKHPNIVTVYNYATIDETEGQFFFVMEYLNGATLEAILASVKKLSEKQAVEIGLQLCEALAYAHQQQIVHRDVKPSNIMVVSGGQIKITDFGIAKLMDLNTALTQTEEVLGTLDYMPPEQILYPKQVDRRADIYAVGAILYEALSTRKPFEDPMIKLWQEPKPLQEVAPAVSKPVAEVVMKAIAGKANERFQTAAEMKQALQALSA